MRTPRSAVALALALGLFVAACGGDDAPAAAPAGSVTIEAGDLFFDPDTVSLTAGGAQITLVNVGAVEHDLVVEGQPGVADIHVDPGETATGDVNLAAGTYTFYCTIPGHRAAGMEGTLNVS